MSEKKLSKSQRDLQAAQQLGELYKRMLVYVMNQMGDEADIQLCQGNDELHIWWRAYQKTNDIAIPEVKKEEEKRIILLN